MLLSPHFEAASVIFLFFLNFPPKKPFQWHIGSLIPSCCQSLPYSCYCLPNSRPVFHFSVFFSPLVNATTLPNPLIGWWLQHGYLRTFLAQSSWETVGWSLQNGWYVAVLWVEGFPGCYRYEPPSSCLVRTVLWWKSGVHQAALSFRSSAETVLEKKRLQGDMIAHF